MIIQTPDFWIKNVRHLCVIQTIALVMLSVLVAGGCGSKGRTASNGQPSAKNRLEPKVEFTEKRLAKIEESKLVDSQKLFLFSNDLSTCIYVIKDKDKHRIKVNDQDFGVYAKVLMVNLNKYTKEPYFIVEESGKQRVCLGKSCGDAFDNIRLVGISSNGDHYAYIGTEISIVSSQDYLIHDGKKIGPYPRIEDYSFNADGTQIAAKVEHDIEADNRWKILHDGKLSKEYFDVGTPVFNPVTNIVAYVATIKKGQKEDTHVVVGNERGRNYGAISPPVFSPSGNSIAYRAGDERIKAIVSKAVVGPGVKDLIYGPVWSPKTERLGYIVKDELRDERLPGGSITVYFVVIGDKQYGPYKGVLSAFIFSNDGKHFMAGVSQGNNLWHLLIDGKLKGSYKKIYDSKFINDRGLITYMVSEGVENHLYIGDRRINTKIPDARAYQFSEDGKKLAYLKIENGEAWRKILTLE